MTVERWRQDNRAEPTQQVAWLQRSGQVGQLGTSSQQYEQAGLTWYHGNKPVFKLVHEYIDGKSYVIPGKKLVEDRLIELRLVVSKDQFIAQFRPGAKGEFETAASGKLATGSDEKVNIQCYNGPSDDTHWMRFSNFRIVKLSE